MPAPSARRTAARREEIVEACAQLYAVMPFKKITLGVIGQKTSFTRTSIYNYFCTKEEIFLALLEREYLAWAEDLEALALAAVPAEEFPARFAALLTARGKMLKLMAMNLYDMESGSRLENLVSFKQVYGRALRAVKSCLGRHCGVTEEETEAFVYAFFPFLFGVYPYTEVTQKQAAAMDAAGVRYRRCSAAELAEAFVRRWLGGRG